MNVAAHQIEHHNEIRLIGRVTADPKAWMLPSEDQVVSVRLVIDRPAVPQAQQRRARVDTVTCAAWAQPQRAELERVRPGDVIEVTGALRRRFWRAPEGPRNRYEVEVTSAVRLVSATA